MQLFVGAANFKEYVQPEIGKWDTDVPALDVLLDEVACARVRALNAVLPSGLGA